MQNKKIFTGLLITAILMIGGLLVALPQSQRHPFTHAAAPAFTVDPHEEWDNSIYGSGIETESSHSIPTTAGTDVDFKATATDGDADDYYLAICKTDAATAVNNSAPTCDGGTWAISSATISGNEATASYTTLDSDGQQNDWYAFVCDHNAASTCSASSQGSDKSGSPFVVNHQPDFADNFSVTDINGGASGPGEQLKFNFEIDETNGDGATVVVCDTTFNDSTRTCDSEELCRADVGWLPLESGTDEGIIGMYFIDDNTGWIIGGTFGVSEVIKPAEIMNVCWISILLTVVTAGQLVLVIQFYIQLMGDRTGQYKQAVPAERVCMVSMHLMQIQLL
jgi:hypothetical protein